MPRLAGLALAIALVLLMQFLLPNLLPSIERTAGDLAWRLVATDQRPERRVVVVDIDEASLAQVGPWPWSRSSIEQLSRKLSVAGASTQVYDMVFPEAKEGDAGLSQAWASASVTAGQIFSLDAAVTPRVGKVAGAVAAQGCPAFAPRSQGFIANAGDLASSVGSVGHLTPRVESDGVVRMVPALVCHEGRAYPTLSMAALWRLAQPPTSALRAPDWRWSAGAAQSGSGRVLEADGYLSSPSNPGLEIPVDADGNLRVPYRLKRAAFASVSAADVLNGRAPAGLLSGAVVLIGATAFGLADVVSTPESAVASGVEVHAQLLVGMLDHRLPWTPARVGLLDAALGGACVLLLFALTLSPAGSGVKRLPVAGLLLAVACFAVFVLALGAFDLWLHWAAPALVSLLAAVLLATVEHGLTRAQRERLRAHLGAYLPAPFARMLMRTDPTGSVEIAQREVSVLVADIRNFSAFATHRPQQETAALLHAFCCIAVDVVEANGGVVENVVGDHVVAIWNAYSDCPEHPQKSLHAAQELLRATRGLLEPRRAIHDSDLVQPLALGVGVETGVALVGSFGPQRRRAHAALGEPVSVATRLQQMTQDISFPILIGPQLARALPSDARERVGEYLLEGLTRHYSVFAPIGWAELVSSDLGWSQRPPAAASGPQPGDVAAAPFGRNLSPASDS